MHVLNGVLATLFAFAGAGAEAPPVTARITQLSIMQRLIIRVPALRHDPPASPWRERRHDRCITMANIAAAGVTRADAVDFILRGGKRVRAYLEASCPALDYYRGFYVVPNADGRVCSDRDVIRDRSGSACEITRFRTLAPRRPGR